MIFFLFIYLCTATVSEVTGNGAALWANIRVASQETPPARWNTSQYSDQCPRTIPPVIRSLFSNVPPVVNFGFSGQIAEELPSSLKRNLKWKTRYIILKKLLYHSNFHISTKDGWLGFWGSPLKIVEYRDVLEYQKFGHFPDTWEVGRKDRLWRNILRMQVMHGKPDFNFVPLTFIFPNDEQAFRNYWEANPRKHKWIVKPQAKARGNGIYVIGKYDDIPAQQNVVVQRYITKPYLINDLKFDLRLYVYIASYEPLRIYLYKEGIVRFATMKFSTKTATLDNRFIHLTNYIVNKKNEDYVFNSNASAEFGHKWALSTLWRYLKNKGVDTDKIWDRISDLVAKTIISSEAHMYSMVNSNLRSHYCSHELYGFDVMFDQNLKPWLLEINVSPSMGTGDFSIDVKAPMLHDLLNTAGFHIPKRSPQMLESTSDGDDSTAEESQMIGPQKLQSLVYASLPPYERAKRDYFTQRASDAEISSKILDVLTPADVRELVQAEDEYDRRGDFQRVFPSPGSGLKYFKYFEQKHYSNLLLDAWVTKYHATPKKGWEVLENLCKQQLHLQNEALETTHNWTIPFVNTDVLTQLFSSVALS